MVIVPADSALTADRPPVLLGVDSHEWSLRSVESVVTPRGYAFVRAYTARQALDLLPQVRPDAIVVAARLADMSVEQFMRSVRELDGGSYGAVPIAVIGATPKSRGDQVGLLEAGAWAVIQLPVDTDVMVAQLGAFVRAHREAQRVRQGALVDAETGLYDATGLHRRAVEAAADAYRDNRALAAIVVSVPEDDNAPISAVEASRQLRAALRQSDILARIGPRQFAALLSANAGADFAAPVSRLRMSMGDTNRLTVHIAAVDAYRDRYIPVADLVAQATAGEASSSVAA